MVINEHNRGDAIASITCNGADPVALPAEGFTLTLLPGQDNACTVINHAPAAGTVTVTIAKYIHPETGVIVHADTTNADSDTFSQQSSWDDPGGIGTGSGTYDLGPAGFNSPNAYEAVTSEMLVGADYSTSETSVDGTCDQGDAWRLVGYGTSSPSVADAAAGTLSMDPPSFTDLQANEFVAVVNAPCPPAGTVTVTIAKYIQPDAGVIVHADTTNADSDTFSQAVQLGRPGRHRYWQRHLRPRADRLQQPERL